MGEISGSNPKILFHSVNEFEGEKRKDRVSCSGDEYELTARGGDSDYKRFRQTRLVQLGTQI